MATCIAALLVISLKEIVHDRAYFLHSVGKLVFENDAMNILPLAGTCPTPPAGHGSHDVELRGLIV